ncbi:phosphoserine phosphatase [Serratia proteamaculans]|uniref:phosphoserine phosphatase n=1 Tax=Serratia proteamaculans TaxID=28151 RepID=UPI0021777553|nr:phosphoserine phosphatase [Serratia proteamaculans]CAI1119853.1 Phosphoserine phosphatase [Serratia proteamaculans]CAI1743841.1 Phosphoserine phosphatase [Serratia proteamaculans]CAI1790490.1 Phosphoserine phosphatase [Serratia proteamaculans]CAI1796677.1 Phosphoserine phosphatase [Serratia proteamaculans]CAI1900651.1 Phosphoserine phosphatase [Serratia proteamaculans]
MSNSLTYCDLPAEISQWPGLPLSLSGDEVMPLDYRAGHTGWLLYGRELNKTRITDFQRKLGAAMVIVTAWCVEDYQVVRLAGTLTARAKLLAAEGGLDVAPLGKIPHLRTPGLLVMDMDSTAIEIECIDEIAKLAGVGEQVSEVTERAMRGELDFTASLRQRVGTLKGADANILKQVRDELPLMPGLINLVRKLQAMDWHVAIASGGFTYYAEYLRDKLKLVAVAANELEIRDGKLTGEVLGSIVDAQFKADTLVALAEKLGIPLQQTVAIGDGANDLKMMQVAGLGIAYHAKPKVYEKAQVSIRHADLIGVLCVLTGSLKHEVR